MTGLRYCVYEIVKGHETVRLGAALSAFNSIEAARKWIDSEGLTNAVIIETCPFCGHNLNRVDPDGSGVDTQGELFDV